MTSWQRRSWQSVLLLALHATVHGCKAGDEPGRPEPGGDDQVAAAPAATPLSSAASAAPSPPPAAAASASAPPYAGPVGIVRGTVLVSGDASPRFEQELKKIPASDCPEAREIYASLFREGPGRTLADALVTVTEYEGVVGATSESVAIEAKGCAWSTRTIGLALGQHLEVKSLDERGYMPKLAGRSGPAAMVAMPGGSAAKVFVAKEGVHVLTDVAHPFSLATIFVLNYPTFDVTKLDGKFEIRGVPVGKARLSAYLPTTGQTTSESVVVSSEAPAEVTLTLPFDATAFEALSAKGKGATPAPSDP